MKPVVLAASGDGLLGGTLPFSLAIPPLSTDTLSWGAGPLAVLGTSAAVNGTDHPPRCSQQRGLYLACVALFW